MTYHPPLSNEILAGLPHAEAQRVAMHVRPVRLVGGQVLIEPGHAVEQVYFVENGLASLVVDSQGKRAGVGVAMIGREGLVGIDALLGGTVSASAAAIVQIPGQAMRMVSRDLRILSGECGEFRRRCLSAASSLFQQVMETSAANARNSLAERCARWLLMAHTRLEHGEIHITHEALSLVLGVRRSGVSVVLSSFQEAGLITVNRGRIGILDPKVLERMMHSATESRDSTPGRLRPGTCVIGEPHGIQRANRAHMMDSGIVS